MAIETFATRAAAAAAAKRAFGWNAGPVRRQLPTKAAAGGRVWVVRATSQGFDVHLQRDGTFR